MNGSIKYQTNQQSANWKLPNWTTYLCSAFLSPQKITTFCQSQASLLIWFVLSWQSAGPAFQRDDSDCPDLVVLRCNYCFKNHRRSKVWETWPIIRFCSWCPWWWWRALKTSSDWRQTAFGQMCIRSCLSFCQSANFTLSSQFTIWILFDCLVPSLSTDVCTLKPEPLGKEQLSPRGRLSRT